MVIGRKKGVPEVLVLPPGASFAAQDPFIEVLEHSEEVQVTVAPLLQVQDDPDE